MHLLIQKFKFLLYKISTTYKSGFTLIELLTVIGILGILLGGVVMAINPVEQIRRGNDTTKKTTLASLGQAMERYYTIKRSWITSGSNANGPDGAQVFIDVLLNNNELRTQPTNSNTTCTAPAADTSFGRQKGYCYRAYDPANNDVAMYVLLESSHQTCQALSGTSVPGCGAANLHTGNTYYVWISNKKTGFSCVNPGNQYCGFDTALNPNAIFAK